MPCGRLSRRTKCPALLDSSSFRSESTGGCIFFVVVPERAQYPVSLDPLLFAILALRNGRAGLSRAFFTSFNIRRLGRICLSISGSLSPIFCNRSTPRVAEPLTVTILRRCCFVEHLSRQGAISLPVATASHLRFTSSSELRIDGTWRSGKQMLHATLV